MKQGEIKVGHTYHHGTGNTVRRVIGIGVEWNAGYPHDRREFVAYLEHRKQIPQRVSLSSFAKWAYKDISI